MTNGEKFKTAEERTEGIRRFCKEFKTCSDCPLYPRNHPCECAYAWLELKYEEELKPCPFCGGTPVMANNIETMRSLSYYVRCACGVRTVSALSESVAAEIWNRRAK